MAASEKKVEALDLLESAIDDALMAGFTPGEIKKTVDAVEKVVHSRTQILAQQSDDDSE